MPAPGVYDQGFLHLFLPRLMNMWRLEGKVQDIPAPDGSLCLSRLILAPGLFLHHFHQGDMDRHPHNHPWKLSFSYILLGGYVEYRGRDGKDVRTLLPGSVNVIGRNTYHRVELLDPVGGCWSLFAHAERIGDWGFWVNGLGHTPKDEYIANRRGT